MHLATRLGRLPFKDNLLKRGIVVENDECVLCKETTEIGDHVLVGCKKAVEVRNVVNAWRNLLPSNCANVTEFWDETGVGIFRMRIRVLRRS